MRPIVISFLVFGMLGMQAHAQETIAFADFSHFPDGKIISNCFNVEAKGCDRNPHYGGKLRFLTQSATLDAQFYMLSDYYDKVVIKLKHLSSKGDGAKYGGYSPMTLQVNGHTVFSEYSPRNHTPEWETYDISDAIQGGKNELTFIAGDLQTHYWLERFEVVLYPPEKPEE